MAIKATLTGFFREDVEIAGEPFYDFSMFTGGCWGVFKYFCLPPCSKNCFTTFKNFTKQTQKEVHLLDAREKQKEEGLSNAEFFQKYGFVLLQHKTKMSAEDWLKSSHSPGPAEKRLIVGKDTAVRNIYSKEVEPLLRELIPGVEEIFLPSNALRRGPKGPNPFYGLGVHQDFGLYPEDMETSYMSWEDSYEEWMRRLQTSGGYSIINFWRPILPMEGPVKDTPLAVCDPNTVQLEHVVPNKVLGFVKGGQKSLMVKFSSEQKWYYYPEMTKDEVLVFRQFHFDRNVAAPYQKLRTVFHTAFKHPKAKENNAEPRCSSEYRVGVWLKNVN
eukprot:s96_g16.t1